MLNECVVLRHVLPVFKGHVLVSHVEHDPLHVAFLTFVSQFVVHLLDELLESLLPGPLGIELFLQVVELDSKLG